MKREEREKQIQNWDVGMVGCPEHLRALGGSEENPAGGDSPAGTA